MTLGTNRDEHSPQNISPFYSHRTREVINAVGVSFTYMCTIWAIWLALRPVALVKCELALTTNSEGSRDEDLG